MCRHLPDAYGAVTQGHVERLAGVAAFVQPGQLGRVGSLVQEYQQAPYAQTVPLEQGAIIQQQVGKFRDGVVAGLKIDGQQPIVRGSEVPR